jgi:hypothetical protein
VEIEVAVFAESLEMRIWDWGEPFDLEQKIKDMSEQDNINSPGGRGLKIDQRHRRQY